MTINGILEGHKCSTCRIPCNSSRKQVVRPRSSVHCFDDAQRLFNGQFRNVRNIVIFAWRNVKNVIRTVTTVNLVKRFLGCMLESVWDGNEGLAFHADRVGGRMGEAAALAPVGLERRTGTGGTTADVDGLLFSHSVQHTCMGRQHTVSCEQRNVKSAGHFM